MTSDLFSPDPSENLLPRDGVVRHFGPVLTPDAADRVFQILLREIPWRHDELVMFGKRIVTAREVAWFGDEETGYTYSGTTKHALPWTPELAELRKLAEALTGACFNSCLLNLYHHGGEGMGWHSDDEKSIVPESAIASLSLGAERAFKLRHKTTKETIFLPLAHGALLVMEGATQKNWTHSVPKSARVTAPRINLTFRRMV